VIKVLSTGAVLTHGSNPSSLEFTPEELQAAVDEASHFGLRVAVHAHAAQGIKNAILAGAASIEHAEMVDDEGIALALKHGSTSYGYLRRRMHKKAAKMATPADFLHTMPNWGNCSDNSANHQS
jgi:imidazolonepropionase-like amidohydrolase